MSSGQSNNAQQYFHKRGTDRLLRDIANANPTAAEVERAKAQARENIARLAKRLLVVKTN